MSISAVKLRRRAVVQGLQGPHVKENKDTADGVLTEAPWPLFGDSQIVQTVLLDGSGHRLSS